MADLMVWLVSAGPSRCLALPSRRSLMGVSQSPLASSLDMKEGGFPPSKIYKQGLIDPKLPNTACAGSHAVIIRVLSSHRRDCSAA